MENSFSKKTIGHMNLETKIECDLILKNIIGFFQNCGSIIFPVDDLSI